MYKIDEYGDLEQLVPIKQIILDRCEEETLSFCTPVQVRDLVVNYQHKLTKADWLEEQLRDPVVGKALGLLNRKEAHKLSALDDPEFKALWKMKNELCIVDKLLYRKVFSSRLDQTFISLYFPKPSEIEQ